MTAPDLPDEAMLEPARRLVRYQETLDHSALDGIFDPDDLTIVDSFAPFIFRGPDAATTWATAFAAHVGDHFSLHATLGPPQEFGRARVDDGSDVVYFSQPVVWRFAVEGTNITEIGGLGVVLVRDGERWRVRHSSWAVTSWVADAEH